MAKQKKTAPQVDLHGAAIIDENGKEVPITESMLSEAFDKLTQDENSDQDKGTGKESAETQ